MHVSCMSRWRVTAMVMMSSSLLEEGPWYFQWFVMNLWAMFPSFIQYIPFALLSYDQYILIFTIKKVFIIYLSRFLYLCCWWWRSFFPSGQKLLHPQGLHFQSFFIKEETHGCGIWDASHFPVPCYFYVGISLLKACWTIL